VRPGVPGWPVGEVRALPEQEAARLLTEYAGSLVLAPEPGARDAFIREPPVTRVDATDYDGDVSGLHLPWRR
jgi:hypothetical protein